MSRETLQAANDSSNGNSPSYSPGERVRDTTALSRCGTVITDHTTPTGLTAVLWDTGWQDHREPLTLQPVNSRDA